jgi:hypothetical protein
VIALFVGPQDREHNVFLNFFWDWWCAARSDPDLI